MARSKYPHLLSVDIPVWERYLSAHGRSYRAIEYDVRVGEGRDPGNTFPENIRQMAIDLSQRRIDAVADDGTSLQVIEITRRAGLRALGQLAVYPVLYREKFHTTKPIYPLLVAEEFESDVQSTFDTHKMPYILLPPPM